MVLAAILYRLLCYLNYYKKLLEGLDRIFIMSLIKNLYEGSILL